MQPFIETLEPRAYLSTWNTESVRSADEITAFVFGAAGDRYEVQFPLVNSVSASASIRHVDPQGQLIWEREVDNDGYLLALGKDGTIWAVGNGDGATRATHLSADGQVLSSGAITPWGLRVEQIAGNSRGQLIVLANADIPGWTPPVILPGGSHELTGQHLIAYKADLTPLWSRKVAATETYASYRYGDLAVGRDNRIHLVGTRTYWRENDGADAYSQPYELQDANVMVRTFSSSGDSVWRREFGNPHVNEYGHDIDVNGRGAVYIASMLGEPNHWSPAVRALRAGGETIWARKYETFTARAPWVNLDVTDRGMIAFSTSRGPELRSVGGIVTAYPAQGAQMTAMALEPGPYTDQVFVARPDGELLWSRTAMGYRWNDTVALADDGSLTTMEVLDYQSQFVRNPPLPQGGVLQMRLAGAFSDVRFTQDGDMLTFQAPEAPGPVMPLGGTAYAWSIRVTGYEGLEIFLGAGDEKAIVDTDLPTTIHGGAGNDTIISNSADDVILGGSGEDVIIRESAG